MADPALSHPLEEPEGVVIYGPWPGTSTPPPHSRLRITPSSGRRTPTHLTLLNQDRSVTGRNELRDSFMVMVAIPVAIGAVVLVPWLIYLILGL